jgi:hypothetical protein
MLWAIGVIFGLLWILGLVTSVTAGGFIHALLGAAITLLVIQAIQPSRARANQSIHG